MRDAYLKSHERDEVYAWLSCHRPAKDWMRTDGRIARPVHVHHIFGRGSAQRYHWFCNLCTTSDAAHAYGHDVCGGQLEIACLMAKMSSEKSRIACMSPIQDNKSRWVWNPEIMAINIGRASLHGRVSELLQRPSIKSTIFEEFGEKLLAFLGE